MRAKTMAAIPAGSRLARVAVVMLTVVALVATVLVAFPRQAEAATQQMYAYGVLTKKSDGQGHGTSAQTFVNSKNGFEVGDNTDSDGVVSSGDIVTYEFKLVFQGAARRTIRVAWDLEEAPYLEGISESCATGGGVTGKVVDGACEYTIDQGAAGEVTQTFTLTGKDTLGTVVRGQVPVLTMARIQGSGASATAVSDVARYEAAPITVVSAPNGDLIARNYDQTGRLGRAERHSMMDEEGATTGYIDLNVVGLKYPGYSNHGASTGGPWSATLDITKMPEGGTYTLIPADGTCGTTEGTSLEVQTEGSTRSLRVEDVKGDQRLCWSLPFESLDKVIAKGGTAAFDIQVIPESTFLMSASGDDALKNMGAGGEPGMGEAKTVSTENADTGADRGFPYPNNDWTRAVIDRAPEGAGAFGKEMVLPYTESRTIFEPENKYFNQATHVRKVSASTEADLRTLVQGTEEEAHLILVPGKLPASAGNGVLILQDMWRADEHTLLSEAGRADAWLTVGTEANPDAMRVDDGDVSLSYATASPMIDAKTVKDHDARLAVPWGAKPANAATVTGVRITMDTQVLTDKYGVNFGDKTSDLRVYMHVRTTALGNTFDDAHTTRDWGDLKLTTSKGEVIPGSASVYLIVHGTEPVKDDIKYDESQTEVLPPSSNGKPSEPRADKSAQPGDTVTFTVNSSVSNLTVTGIKMWPHITVTLPAALYNPESVDPAWKLAKVSEPDANGIRTAEFVPVETVVTPDISVVGEAQFPPLKWRAHVSAFALGGKYPVPAVLTGTREAHPSMDTNTDMSPKALPEKSTETTLVIQTMGGTSGQIEALTPRVEINDPIAYHFTVSSAGTAYNASKNATTVIRFPESGADKQRVGADAKGLDHSWGDYSLANSDYTGSYTLAGPIEFNADETSEHAVVYYSTTKNVFSDEPSDYQWMTWDQLVEKTGKGSDIPGVTAIKVVAPFKNIAAAGTEPYNVSAADGVIRLQPSANHAGEQYNMWIGANHYDKENAALYPDAQDPVTSKIPWPAVAKTVASTISGTVWWDNNKDTAVGSDTKDEPRIGNVLMSLERFNSETNAYEPALDNDGQPITTLTDSSGYYEFTNLHSGQYKVTIARTDTEQTGGEEHAVQKTTTSYYNEHLAVGTTRSYKAVLDNATDDSGDIILGVDTTVPKVNFGYVPQDPKVTLDKSQNYMTCNAQNCTVSWDVKVTNTGNTTIEPDDTFTKSYLTDRMSSAVTIDPADPNAITTGLNGSGQPTYAFFTKVSLGYSSGFAIDKDGHLWAWGRDAKCRLGLDTNNGACYGDDDYRPSVLPTRMTVQEGGQDVVFKDVTALKNGGIAIDANNHVWGWGSNTKQRSYGRNLGSATGPILPYLPVDGSLAVPTRLDNLDRAINLAPGESITKVSGSWDTVGVLTSLGRVIAWGSNSYGQITAKTGDNTDTAQPTVVQGWTTQAGTDRPIFDRAHGLIANDLIVTGLNIFIQDQEGHIWAQGDRREGLTQNRDTTDKYVDGGKSSFKKLKDASGQDVVASSMAALDIALVYGAKDENGQQSLYGLGYSSSAAGTMWNSNAIYSTEATDGTTNPQPPNADNRYMLFHTSTPLKLQAPARDLMTGKSVDLLQGFTISQIAAGGGGVMVLGKDSSGTERIIQLGTAKNSLRNGTSTVNLPAGETVSQMILNPAQSGSDNYALSVGAVLTDQGHLYTWGSTEYAVTGMGQVSNGRGGSAEVSTPTDVTPAIPPDPDPTGISLMCANDKRTNDGTACPADGATRLYREGSASGTTTRTLPLKYTLEPGQSVYYHFTGTVARDQAKVTKVTNQAIFTSPETPYYTPNAEADKALGVPAARVEAAKAGSNNPYLPTLPNANNIVESTHDVTGTNACVTGTDVGLDKEHSFDLHLEDSCDQVGAVIPPLPSKQLGSISGLYWMDANGDGKQSDDDAVSTGNGEEKAVKHFAGQKVELVDTQTGKVLATTATDANGAYSFTNLPLDTTYTVKFSRVTSHRFTRSDVDDEASKVTDGSLVDSDVDTSSTAEMVPSSATTIRLDANTPNRVHIDAGVLLPSAQAMPHTGANTLMILAGLAFLGMLGSAWILSGRRAPQVRRRRA